MRSAGDESYVNTTLGECCEVISGATPRRDRPEYWDGDIPWVTPKELGALEGTVLRQTEESITEAGFKSCSTRMLPAGAVLFSSRAPIGLVAIAGIPLCTNQGFKSFIPGPEVDSGYLYWWLKHHAVAIARRGTGTTFAEISKEGIERIPIVLPPLPEQRRVAAVLDRVEGVRGRRRKTVDLLYPLRTSAFLHLVGEAHADYQTWPEHCVEELAAPGQTSLKTGPFGSALRHSEFVDEGVAVLGIDNAVANEFRWAERRFISPAKYQELTRYTVHPGDVLVTLMGTIGRSSVVPEDCPAAVSTKHLATITVDRSKVLPAFLSHAFHCSPTIARQLGTATRGAIMPALNLGIIKRLRVRLPPLALQQRFEEVVLRLAEVRSRLSESGASVASLSRQIAAAAFGAQL